MSRPRIIVEKTHLIMQRPYISSRSHMVGYRDEIACGKNPDNVDSTQMLGQVDCKICLAYIQKRMDK